MRSSSSQIAAVVRPSHEGQVILAFFRRARNLMAKRRLERLPAVEISPTAKVEYARIRIRPGCTLRVGAGSIVEGNLVFERPGARITIGQGTFIGGSSLIAAVSIEVGDDVLVAWGTTLVDHDSHSVKWDERRDDVRRWYVGEKDWHHVKTAPIRVGNRSWLGFNAIVLKGITVGEESVVAAGSVVTRDVPPRCVVAGNPARVIRHLEPVDGAEGPDAQPEHGRNG